MLHADQYVALMAALTNVTKLIADARWTDHRKGIVPADDIMDLAAECSRLLDEPIREIHDSWWDVYGHE